MHLLRARRVLQGMALDFACEPPSEKQLSDAEATVALLEPTVRWARTPSCQQPAQQAALLPPCWIWWQTDTAATCSGLGSMNLWFPMPGCHTAVGPTLMLGMLTSYHAPRPGCGREGEPLFAQLRESLGFGRLRWAVSGTYSQQTGSALAPAACLQLLARPKPTACLSSHHWNGGAHSMPG